MNIAICMDVAADRKQLERLLGRIIDKRLLEDDNMPIYARSYGNKDALLARPFLYDLFFIDIINDTIDSVQLVRELRSLGVTATIVLCPNQTDLSDELTDEDEVYVIKQPFSTDTLDDLVGIAVAEVKARVPKLELRTTSNTIWITEEEFLYAERKKDTTLVHLADGREIVSCETIDIFFERSQCFSNVFNLPDNLVVNIIYIAEIGIFSVTLKDKRKFRVSRKWLNYMLEKSNLPG